MAELVQQISETMVKTKKSKSAGRFGARYGRLTRARLVNVEQKQNKKQICPFCKKPGAKRLSKGLWHCKKCNKKFASDVFHLGDKLIKEDSE